MTTKLTDLLEEIRLGVATWLIDKAIDLLPNRHPALGGLRAAAEALAA